MMICWGDSAKLEELKTAARAQANLPPVKTGMHAKQTMADLAVFERETVSRYYGFQAARPGARTLDDLEETLPVPILEGLRTLRTNVYVSLGDLQLKVRRVHIRVVYLLFSIAEIPERNDPRLALACVGHHRTTKPEGTPPAHRGHPERSGNGTRLYLTFNLLFNSVGADPKHPQIPRDPAQAPSCRLAVRQKDAGLALAPERL